MTRPSYAHGVSLQPLLGETLGQCLDRIAASHGEREAIVARQHGVRLTYARLHASVTELARSFLASGVEAGDRVGIWSAGRAEWLIAQYAVAKVGAILVSINPALRAAELDYALAHAGVSLLIAGPRFANVDSVRVLAEVLSEQTGAASAETPSVRLPTLRTIVYLGEQSGPRGLSWREFMTRGTTVAPHALQHREALVTSDAPALMLFTSGTTGRPKAVVLSHHAVVNGGFFVGRWLRYTPEDRICLPLPLYHVLGCVAAAVAAVTHGSALIIPSDLFDAGRCLETVQDERCTAMYGVPTMFIAQLEHPGRAHVRLDSLRTGVVSGAACAADVMRRVMTDLHMPEITVGYGMTEMSPILYTAPGDRIENRVSTAGTVQCHVECQIVDPVTGRVQPRGAQGELRARGYGRMLGYWNDPEATRAAIDGAGWMHTGDLAVMRDDGYVSIVGRLKDIIIRGGENIAASEIEQVLHAHPKIREAYVIGVPDRHYGEELCACVRLLDRQVATPEELRQHCRRHLAVHKIPLYVYVVSELPLTASGKVQKFRLREQAIAWLGLQPAATVAAPASSATSS